MDLFDFNMPQSMPLPDKNFARTPINSALAALMEDSEEVRKAKLMDKTIDALEAEYGHCHLRDGAFLYYRDYKGNFLSLCVGKGNTVFGIQMLHLDHVVGHYDEVPVEARR